MKIKNYKSGDVPDPICTHEVRHIKFGINDKARGRHGFWIKCPECSTFTEEEITCLKKQPQYYSEEFIKTLRLKE